MSIYTIERKGLLSRQVHENIEDLLVHLKDLYNSALEERISCYQKTGQSLSLYDQMKSLTELRQDNEYTICSAITQRSILKNIDFAFKNFFRRIKAGQTPGFPRFKGRYRKVRSFEVNVTRIGRHSDDLSFINIKGIGKIKFKHLPEINKIKQVRLVKTDLGIKLQFMVDMDKAIKSQGGTIGIDLGISNRLVTSNGEYLDGKKLDRSELKKKQRQLSRAKKGSNNRSKKRKSLAKEWKRTTIRERNELHGITTGIVKKYNKIILEKLNTKGMAKNRYLARSIHEQQWGMMTQMLCYKAANAGGEVVFIDPKYTSQDCSGCGHRQKMSLDKRTYHCPKCDLKLDRDHNAAINILTKGGGSANAPMTVTPLLV